MCQKHVNRDKCNFATKQPIIGVLAIVENPKILHIKQAALYIERSEELLTIEFPVRNLFNHLQRLLKSMTGPSFVSPSPNRQDFQMSRLFAATILDQPGELDKRLEAAHRFPFVAITVDCQNLNCEKSSFVVSSRLADGCLGEVGRSETEVNLAGR